MGVKVRDVKGDGNWWVVVHHRGRRTERKIGPNPAEAEAVAREMGRRFLLGIEAGGLSFAEVAERYLAEDTFDLAKTTREDRAGHLGDGPLGRWFGMRSVASILPETLGAWWRDEIVGRGLSTKTGKNRLDTLGAVLEYAIRQGMIDRTPVPAFRESLRRRRTKASRAESDPQRNIRPIERLAELRALMEASRSRPEWHLADLTLLDAGLRLGEVGGLQWEDVWWGGGPDDESRHLFVRHSRPRGHELQDPKSGRARRVALSRRLRHGLICRWQEVDQPEQGPVFPDFDQRNHRRRFRRVCELAGIGPRRLKDLRDSYACHLLSAGVQLGYVSAQLGHADVAVTARHYARWTGEDGYRAPIALLPGELPPDLLERLSEPDSARRWTALGRRQRSQKGA